MLNTRKYLYILPDSAYVAELLPTKKPHSFAIHAFRQINGEFLDDNEFIGENVQKLIKKIDPEEYHLILPDFLFTNTTVDIKETDEGAVKKYLKETLLPSLGLSTETHQVETFILTQHQGKTKVQLSALEKSLLAPIQKAAGEHKLTITSISALSWTVKSIVSLEPSITTIQIGSNLYLAQHYIGVDQTVSFKIEETENIAETVKTLKGAEPNIQTMYLLTNGLVESELKEKLSNTLPIQQLSNFTEEQEGIPPYLKQIIEACAKTLDIPEYPVPKFELGTYNPAHEKAEAAAKVEKSETQEKVEAAMPITPPKVIPLDLDDVESEEKADEMVLPLPEPNAHSKMPEPTIGASAPTKETTTMTETVEVDTFEVKVTESPIKPTPAEPVMLAATATSPVAPTIAPSAAPKVTVIPELKPVSTMPVTSTAPTTPAPTVVPFTYPSQSMFDNKPTQPPAFSAAPPAAPALNNQERPRQVIKNSGDAGSLIKIVMITIGALVVTVAVGVGIGFGLLTMTTKKGAAPSEKATVVSATPTPAATIAPTATPAPTPTPVAMTAAAKAKYTILVVNATKTAGLAGKLKTTLTAAGYKTIDTGNAKGQYTGNSLVLLATDDESMVTTLSTDAKTTLTFSPQKATEDPSGKYDAVIVLAQ